MPGNRSVKVISAELDSELVKQFWDQVEERGIKKKCALAGAVKLWLSMPQWLQVYILGSESRQELFADMMNCILNREIDQVRRRIQDRPAESEARVQSESVHAASPANC